MDGAATPDQARHDLQRVRERLDAAHGDREGSPEVESLRAAIRRHALPRRPFDDLLEGVSWDIEGRRYETTEELREYCYRVASTVGLLCVRIFGCPGERADDYARELGVALQWTNILRDIGSDFERGRIYLPRRSMARHGLDEAALERRDADDRGRLTELIADEARYAEACFKAAARALHPDDRSRVLSGEIMGAVYHALLQRVRRAGAAVLDRRVAVPKALRAWIAGRLLIQDRLGFGRRGG